MEPEIRTARLNARARTGKQKNVKKKMSKAPSERCGFLLRSMAVRDWPGLEAVAFGDENSAKRLELLRMERLAPDVMLCIFEGTPQRVELREPGEGIQLGLDPGNMVRLRHIIQASLADSEPGSEVRPPKAVTAGMDPFGKSKVLNVWQLAEALETSLKEAGLFMGADLDKTSENERVLLSSADLAVQLLQPPYVQPFAGVEDKRDLPEKAMQYVFLLRWIAPGMG
jgi:hypothetical protein